MLVLFLPPLALIWETVIAIKKICSLQHTKYRKFDKECLWIYSFVLCTADQRKKHILFKESSIEHSYQVCFQLPQWFQRRRHHFDTFGHLGLMFLLCTSIINILQNQSMAIPSKFGSYIYWSCSFFRRLKTDNPLFDTFGFGLLASFEFF